MQVLASITTPQGSFCADLNVEGAWLADFIAGFRVTSSALLARAAELEASGSATVDVVLDGMRMPGTGFADKINSIEVFLAGRGYTPPALTRHHLLNELDAQLAAARAESGE